MSTLKPRKVSTQCPKCMHQWGRKPTPQEEIFGGFASGSIDMRLLLYLWDNNCKLCGKKFKSFEETTIDHIIPKSKGGLNHITNYQLSHLKCNAKKGNGDVKPIQPKYLHENKLRVPDDILKKIKAVINN